MALAKTIVSKANFLLLDEPTNHLDIHCCELLIEALNKYEGSMILVSHDRYFISKTANKIWEIVDHEIKEFKGGYEEWVAWNERMESQKSEARGPKKYPEKTKPEPVVSKPQPASNKPAAGIPVNKESKKELQRLQKQFEQLEQKIADLNKKKKQYDDSLADPSTYSDKSKFQEMEAAWKKSEKELDSLNQEYEKVFERIMELEKQTG